MPPVSVSPFYADWQFWSAVAAWVALVIASWRPVVGWLKHPRLRVETYSKVSVSTWYGYPRVFLHLLLTNTGAKDLRVMTMRVVIKRDHDDFTLPATVYFRDGEDKIGLLMTAFRLRPEAEWVHGVNFFSAPSRLDDKMLREWHGALIRDITDKRKGLPKDAPDVAGDEKFWRPLEAHFRSKFRWHSGEYSMGLFVDVEPTEASFEKWYRFTIFESESAEMEKPEDDFRFGYINEHRDVSKAAFVNVSLEEK